MEPDDLDVAVGVGVLQYYDNRLHPIVQSNEKYIPSERNYAPHGKELLAIFKAFQSEGATLMDTQLWFFLIINY